MKRNSSTQTAYEKLKEMIADQELLPGEQIVETVVAGMLGCSRTPVREAIRMLPDEGLVDMIPKLGAFLKKVTKTDVIMAFEVTEAIEGMVCYLAAERVNNGELYDEDFEKLNHCLEEMEQCIREERVKDWAVLDDHFHVLLVELSGNDMLMQERKRTVDQINQVLWFVTPSSIDKALSNREHKEIVEAIRAGDLSLSRERAQAHRHRVREELKRMLL